MSGFSTRAIRPSTRTPAFDQRPTAVPIDPSAAVASTESPIAVGA
jgi:hypothetical protein